MGYGLLIILDSTHEARDPAEFVAISLYMNDQTNPTLAEDFAYGLNLNNYLSISALFEKAHVELFSASPRTHQDLHKLSISTNQKFTSCVARIPWTSSGQLCARDL